MTKKTAGKGVGMAGQGNEKTDEATRKAKKSEGHEGEEGHTPESGALGGDEDPGHAPMGGGDQQHNTKAGSKVEDVGDEGDPNTDRK